MSILRKNKIIIRPTSNRKKSSINIHVDSTRRDSKPVRFVNRKMSNVFEDITAINLEPKSNELTSIQEINV